MASVKLISEDETTWRSLQAIMGDAGQLHRLTKETFAVAVATSNDCYY